MVLRTSRRHARGESYLHRVEFLHAFCNRPIPQLLRPPAVLNQEAGLALSRHPNGCVAGEYSRSVWRPMHTKHYLLIDLASTVALRELFKLFCLGVCSCFAASVGLDCTTQLNRRPFWQLLESTRVGQEPLYIGNLTSFDVIGIQFNILNNKHCKKGGAFCDMPVTNVDLLNQVHLSGEAPCSVFQPHPLKANFCTSCSKLVNKHSASSIPDDDCLLRVNNCLMCRVYY